MKNKKSKKTKRKAKVTRKSPVYSKRTLFLRKFRRTLKLITRQRIYITIAVIVLFIVASSAAYAVNNRNNMPSKTSETINSTDTDTVNTNDETEKTTETPQPTLTTLQSETASCYQIQTSAETQFLKTTSALTYPHYGNPKAVFDAYNYGYRQAYNNYLATVRAHNCSVTVADKGDVQYGSPTCTQAYADNNVVVLRNQIISGVNLDMAEYERWEIAGLPKTAQQIAAEQAYIQNKNNIRVQGYVSKTNVILNSIYCPSLNPADFYTHMF